MIETSSVIASELAAYFLRFLGALAGAGLFVTVCCVTPLHTRLNPNVVVESPFEANYLDLVTFVQILLNTCGILAKPSLVFFLVAPPPGLERGWTRQRAGVVEINLTYEYCLLLFHSDLLKS